MSTTELTQLIALSEKLYAVHGANQVQPEEGDLYTPAHQRAFERLQIALREFGKDPMNQDRSKSMLHAIDTYQTASEMMILRMENALDQMDDPDENLSYEDAFKQYM